MGTIALQFRPSTTVWDGGGGTDRRKLTENVGDVLNADNASRANFGTSGSKTICIDPFTSSTNVTANRTDVGWLINLDGADGVEGVGTGANQSQRRILAGNWVLQGRAHAFPANALGNVFFRVRAYKRNSGDTYVFLGESNEQNLGLVPAAGTAIDVTISGVAEVLLSDNETILIVPQFRGTGQIGGLEISFRVDHGTAVGQTDFDTILELPSPGVRTKYYLTLVGVLKGISRIIWKKRFAAVNFGSAVMRGVASSSRRLSLHRTSAAVMRGLASVKKKKTFATTSFGSAEMVGVGNIKKKKRFDPANFGSARMAGVGSMKKLIRYAPLAARMAGVATLTRFLALKRTISARNTGVASIARVFIGRRVLAGAMVGRVSAFAKLAFGKVPSGGGGGTTIIKKIMYLFDE